MPERSARHHPHKNPQKIVSKSLNHLAPGQPISAEPAVEASPEPIPARATSAEPGTAATGPRTEEGKSVSSRNAVRHGLTAKKLTGADLDTLNAIRTKLDKEWEPQTETEKLLLAQMALSQWRLDRALELELAALHADEDGEIDPAALTVGLRYRTSAERTFFKSLAECSACASPYAKTRFARAAATQRKKKRSSASSKRKS